MQDAAQARRERLMAARAKVFIKKIIIKLNCQKAKRRRRDRAGGTGVETAQLSPTGREFAS